MKHLIYDNYEMLENNDEELIDAIADQRNIPIEDITEDDLFEFKNDTYNDYYDDEIANLDVELPGRIIAIANLGLWSGRVGGYKIGANNLNEVVKMGNQDYNSVWSDGYNIRKKAIHHDGTNCILFRMLREDRNVDHFTDLIYNNKPITKNILNYYTRSVERYVRNVYGY
jgi:hypothetical protein